MINVRMQTTKDTVQKLSPKITVIGVGGAGGNAVNNMIASGLQGCEFVVCNSDAQALEGSLSEIKIQLGAAVTGGLGAGAKPEIGMAAAEESIDDVMQYLEGSNMAFITAGMGGGTGTGAAPVIARACREAGILTVGVVTKPFHFEGTLRMKMAEAGIAEMQGYVDTLIVIPNQNLFRVANEKTTFAEAFKMADSVLQSGVRGVTDLMVMPGLINLDFADIRSAMLEMGKAMMGTGESGGEKRAIEAAEAAINNPLLDDVSMKGARGVIINVTGGMDMTLFEVDEACNRIRDEVDANANIIFGSTFDEALEGVMRVSVVATGIDVVEEKSRFSTRGPSIINALTGREQQERKMERAQPNTGSVENAASDTPAEQGQAPVQQAPAATFIPSSALKSAIPTAPVRPTMPAERQESKPVPVQTETSGGMPKATVYQDAFIPPKPVEAGSYSPSYQAPTELPMMPEAAQYSQPVQQPQQQPVQVQQQQQDMMAAPLLGGLVATRQAPGEIPAQGTVNPSLNLKPPVPGASGGSHKKRTPSLFERFTNPLWNHGHDSDRSEESGGRSGETGNGGNGGGNGGGGGYAPAARTAQRPLQQGSLNIDSNPNPEGAEDELDIPAFLRRQAN